MYSLTENGAAGTDSSHNSISLPDFSMKLLQICPILPLDAVYEEPPASAAIRPVTGPTFLYVSTRFAELITVFKTSHGRLEQIQQTGCGGIHPATWFLHLTAGTCWWQTAPKADWSAFSSTRKQGASGHMLPRTCAGSCFHCSSQHTI